MAISVDIKFSGAAGLLNYSGTLCAEDCSDPDRIQERIAESLSWLTEFHQSEREESLDTSNNEFSVKKLTKSSMQNFPDETSQLNALGSHATSSRSHMNDSDTSQEVVDLTSSERQQMETLNEAVSDDGICSVSSDIIRPYHALGLPLVSIESINAAKGKVLTVRPVLCSYVVNRLDSRHWNSNALYRSMLRGGNQVFPSWVAEESLKFPLAQFYRAETRGQYGNSGGSLYIWCCPGAKLFDVIAFVQSIAVTVLPNDFETNRPLEYNIPAQNRSIQGSEAGGGRRQWLDTSSADCVSVYLYGGRMRNMTYSALRLALREEGLSSSVHQFNYLRQPQQLLEVQFCADSTEEARERTLDYLCKLISADGWRSGLMADGIERQMERLDEGQESKTHSGMGMSVELTSGQTGAEDDIVVTPFLDNDKTKKPQESREVTVRLRGKNSKRGGRGHSGRGPV